MTAIHLMVGFMGVGKTTIAKQLAKTIPAERLTHDELMVKRYGRNPEDFQTKYNVIDEEIRKKTAELIKEGKSVILDYGFWTHQKREEYYTWAKTLTNNVIFHDVCCDINVAKQRILKRTKNDFEALEIDENTFDTLAQKFESWNYMDDYPVVFYNAPNTKYIGQLVQVKIDRPLGSKHPKHGFEYPINYGFIPCTKSGDGEELDAYVLMIDKPLMTFVGRCIGVVHRIDDDDDKLIVVPEACNLSVEEIERQIDFQEKWFEHILVRESV